MVIQLPIDGYTIRVIFVILINGTNLMCQTTPVSYKLTYWMGYPIFFPMRPHLWTFDSYEVVMVKFMIKCRVVISSKVIFSHYVVKIGTFLCYFDG